MKTVADKKPLMPLQEALDAVESLQAPEGRIDRHIKKTAAEKMVIALQVLSLIQQGKTLRSIGAELGMSHVTAIRYRELALATIAPPIVEDARKEMIEQMDAIIEGSMALAASGDKDAVANIMKATERKAKLLGLDAPVRVEAQVAEVTQADLELQQMIREAAAEAAAKESQLKEQ